MFFLQREAERPIFITHGPNGRQLALYGRVCFLQSLSVAQRNRTAPSDRPDNNTFTAE